MFKKHVVITVASLLVAGISAQASDRPVCEVLHGQSRYSDNSIRVSNFMIQNRDVKADCGQTETPKQVEAKVEEVKAPVVEAAVETKPLATPDLDVTFNINSATLNTKAKSQLKSLSEYLKADSKKSIVIGGHTDSTGSKEINEKLANLRAQSAMEFLVNEGISADRIQTKALAADAPVANNQSAAERALNRRISVSFE